MNSGIWLSMTIRFFYCSDGLDTNQPDLMGKLFYLVALSYECVWRDSYENMIKKKQNKKKHEVPPLTITNLELYKFKQISHHFAKT